MSRKTDEKIHLIYGTTTGHWKKLSSGEIMCNLCPRSCHIQEGKSGHCLVRVNDKGKLSLITYGLCSGLALDPIEKKPLYHFYPGSSVLSFGTAGCNLSCQFCQNWTLSKATNIRNSSIKATPSDIVKKAHDLGAKSVAYTYNDPIVFFEYAIDTANLCHNAGIKNIAVTNGYMNKKSRTEFYKYMDAANVDIKSFSEHFYRNYTDAKLSHVLKTLVYIREQTNVWLEVTNLIIPTLNDSSKEITTLCKWVLDNLGSTTPIHFSAFHPDYLLNNIPSTPLSTLIAAYKIAKDIGLKYVYLGNIPKTEFEDTKCHFCSNILVERFGYRTNVININEGRCTNCSTRIPGCF